MDQCYVHNAAHISLPQPPPQLYPSSPLPLRGNVALQILAASPTLSPIFDSQNAFTLGLEYPSFYPIPLFSTWFQTIHHRKKQLNANISYLKKLISKYGQHEEQLGLFNI